LEWVQFEQTRARERNEVVALVGDFLGEGASERSVVTRSLPVFEHVNLQAALDAWAREPGRGVAVHGISIPPHHGSVNLQQLLTGEAMTPIRLSAPPLVDLPNDHCPRCLARSRAMVELFASTRPSDELYGAGLAPNGTIARPAGGDQRVSRDH
jgi:hypothetical protein